jgi:hypothetical protein
MCKIWHTLYTCVRHSIHLYTCVRHSIHLYTCVRHTIHPYICVRHSIHTSTCVRHSIHSSTYMRYSIHPSTCVRHIIHPSTCVRHIIHPSKCARHSIHISTCERHSIHPATCVRYVYENKDLIYTYPTGVSLVWTFACLIRYPSWEHVFTLITSVLFDVSVTCHTPLQYRFPTWRGLPPMCTPPCLMTSLLMTALDTELQCAVIVVFSTLTCLYCI